MNSFFQSFESHATEPSATVPNREGREAISPLGCVHSTPEVALENPSDATVDRFYHESIVSLSRMLGRRACP